MSEMLCGSPLEGKMMTELDKPEFMWAIGHDCLSITNRLFSRDLHLFKKGAATQISEYERIWKEEGLVGTRLMPVLVLVTTVMADDAQANKYHAEQTAWLAKNGSAAKRAQHNA